MAAYMLGLLYAKDYSWLPEYKAHVPDIIKKYGGEYNFLAEHGTIEKTEGDIPVPSGVVSFTFPDKQAALSFLHSEEYKPFIDLRNEHSVAHMFVFDGVKLP